MLIRFNNRNINIDADNLEDIYKEIGKTKPLSSVEENKVVIQFVGKMKTGKRLQGSGKFLKDSFFIIKMECF